MGAASLESDKNETPHYKVVGENAGQPFDSNTGLPVPTALGHPLIPCEFDYDPTAIIARTKDKALAPFVESVPTPALLDKSIKDMEDRYIAQKTKQKKTREEQVKRLDAIKKTNRAYRHLARTLENCVLRRFTKKEYFYDSDQKDAKNMAITTLGTSRAISWLTGDEHVSLKRHFKIALNRFRNKQKSLTGEEEKTYFAEQERKIRFTYAAEKAVSAFKCAETEKDIRGALKKANRLTKTFNLSVSEGQQFKKALLKGEISAGDYYDKLADNIPKKFEIDTGHHYEVIATPCTSHIRRDWIRLPNEPT